ncbi:hypothetical protein SKAU_G00302070 [Synaphobranchus kaupii]|uniref:Secreted protein n=1 Tax=Synaphobranchus kaupii TaxID=118154 RepID=A0A9Q1EVV5_SYNKA|nr:hypothetical protein SKAU_G00302070 [Synaphobranchus kaupii]
MPSLPLPFLIPPSRLLFILLPIFDAAWEMSNVRHAHASLGRQCRLPLLQLRSPTHTPGSGQSRRSSRELMYFHCQTPTCDTVRVTRGEVPSSRVQQQQRSVSDTANLLENLRPPDDFSVAWR